MARLVSLLSSISADVHRITSRVETSFRVMAYVVQKNFGRNDPEDFTSWELAAAGSPAQWPYPQTVSTADRTKELLDDIFGTLFAVQKKRRTLARRKRMKAGMLEWAPHGAKLLVAKKDIVACQTCGNYHELRYLCDICYERVKEATKPIQEAMIKAFTGRAVDQDVQVRYRGEAEQLDTSVKYLEIDDKRPEWFSENLLSKTNRTQLPSEPSESTKS